MNTFIELVILPPVLPLLAVLVAARIEDRLDRQPSREHCAASVMPPATAIPPGRQSSF